MATELATIEGQRAERADAVLGAGCTAAVVDHMREGLVLDLAVVLEEGERLGGVSDEGLRTRDLQTGADGGTQVVERFGVAVRGAAAVLAVEGDPDLAARDGAGTAEDIGVLADDHIEPERGRGQGGRQSCRTRSDDQHITFFRGAAHREALY